VSLSGSLRWPFVHIAVSLRTNLDNGTHNIYAPPPGPPSYSVVICGAADEYTGRDKIIERVNHHPVPPFEYLSSTLVTSQYQPTRI
jgi:hypothetical protein